jgi:hypothetical protein
MRRSLLSLALFLSLGAFAETSGPPARRYYAEVESPFYIGGLVRLQGSGFSLVPGTNGALGVDNSLHYRPATQLLFGLAARYKIIGGEITFSLPFLASFQADEGKSTYQDWRINYYGHSWGIELNYSDWKGYLIEGLRGTGGETYYLLPDLRNTGAGVVLYYVFSGDRYSLGASFDQRERQLVSAGSFFLVGSFRYQEKRMPGLIIPTSKQADFGADGTLSRSAMRAGAAGIGYGLHLVFMDFFLSTAVIAEIGPQWVDYTVASGALEHTFIGLNGRVRVALGHNGKTLLTGVNVYADAFTEGTRDTLIVNASYGAQVFLGFRL